MELNQALVKHKDDLVSILEPMKLSLFICFDSLTSVWSVQVIVKYGSSFCYHCQQMLPHFMKLSKQVPIFVLMMQVYAAAFDKFQLT